MDADSNLTMGYISLPLSEKISNQFPFHIPNRSSIGLIPLLVWSVSFTDDLITHQMLVDIINFE